MKRVLITGSSGLIGTNLINFLSRQDSIEIYAVSNFDYINTNRSVTIINCDLGKPIDISMFPRQMDVIIHMALSPSFKMFPENSIVNFNVNTTSTLHLLEYALKSNASHFIFTSTGGVYSTITELPHTEDEAINLQGIGNFYYSTKLCSEILLNDYSDLLNICILRMFYVYGKEQKPEMLIPRLISNIKAKKAIHINKDGGIKINPIHVSDAVNAIWACSKIEGFNIINVAGDEIVTIRQLCDTIGTLLQIEPIYEYGDSSHSIIGCNEKMKKLLIQPSASLVASLSDMIH